ncbi:MAG: hypothetical protein ACRED2_04215 [Methylocella sp.]
MTSDCGEEPSLPVITPVGEDKDSAPPAIAAKADDLLEIKKSVEDAASVSGGLWLSYLFVLFCIATAAGAVTHDDFIMNKDCPVSAALTDDDKANLLKIEQDAEEKFAPPKASMEEKKTGTRPLARAPSRSGYAERP